MHEAVNDFHLIRKLAENPLPPEGLIQKMIALPSVSSTNDYAKQYIQNHSQPAGTIIIADEQSSGRGRLDRRWLSPPGTGLWFSVILEPAVIPQEWFAYSFLTALVTAGTLQKVCGIHADLKWPNDVMVSGKKCCGILIETVWNNEQPFIIIGTGINVSQAGFPEELKSVATSVLLETHQIYQRPEILMTWLSCLNEYRKFHIQDIIQEWKRHSTMLGKNVSVYDSGTVYDAVARDVADDGALVVTVNGLLRRLYAGDVKLRIRKEESSESEFGAFCNGQSGIR